METDNDTLLGKAGLPVWLSPERFLQQEFDPDTCVADLRRYVRACLHVHAARQNTIQASQTRSTLGSACNGPTGNAAVTRSNGLKAAAFDPPSLFQLGTSPP